MHTRTPVLGGAVAEAASRRLLRSLTMPAARHPRATASWWLRWVMALLSHTAAASIGHLV